MAVKAITPHVIECTGVDATDTAAWNAWLAMSPRPPAELGGTGTSLRLTSASLVSSGRFELDGKGKTIIQKGNFIPVNVVRSMGTQDLCDECVTVAHDISGTSSLNDVTRIHLTTAGNAALYPVGRIVLVSSEDVAPHASVGEAGRMGQTMRVAKIDAGTGHVWFNTTVWRPELYTTDVRITDIPSQDAGQETIVKDVKFFCEVDDAAASPLATRLVPGLWMENCCWPDLDYTVVKSCSAGAFFGRMFGGTIKYVINEIQFSTGEGAPANGQLGYGALLACCDSVAFRCYGTKCRHIVSTNWRTGTTGATSRHGPVINCSFTGIAWATKGACWDCHSDGVNLKFYECQAYGARGDSTGLGAGYQARGGESNTFSNCKDMDCEWGIQIFENTIDGTEDVLVTGHDSDAKKGCILFAGNAGSTRKLNANIQGGLFRSRNGPIVQGTRFRVQFNKSIFQPRGLGGGSLFNITSPGESVVLGDIIYDPINAGGTWILASFAGSNNVMDVCTETAEITLALPTSGTVTLTDLSSDRVESTAALVGNITLGFSIQGRKNFIIDRTSTGAFNVNITHSGASALALAQNKFAKLEIQGSRKRLIATGDLA